MRLFCKHNYIMIFAEGYEHKKIVETDMGKCVTLKQHCGCSVYCTKCGKQKKHLSKKIGKLYANTRAFQFVKEYKEAIGNIQVYKIPTKKEK